MNYLKLRQANSKKPVFIFNRDEILIIKSTEYPNTGDGAEIWIKSALEVKTYHSGSYGNSSASETFKLYVEETPEEVVALMEQLYD